MTFAWDHLAAARDPVAALPRIEPAVAIAVAAAEFGVAGADIIGPAKTWALTPVRAFVVWALRSQNPPLSYPRIGAAMGGRDHSTAVHFHQHAICLRLRDPAFAGACQRFAARVAAMEDHHADR